MFGARRERRDHKEKLTEALASIEREPKRPVKRVTPEEVTRRDWGIANKPQRTSHTVGMRPRT